MLMEVARLGITGARRTKIQARKLLMSTMLVASVSVHAATLSGTVVGVSDGDTITVLDANGCESASPSLLVEEPAELKVDLGADIEAALGDSVYLSALTTVDVDLLDTIVWRPLLDSAAVGKPFQQYLPLQSWKVNVEVTDTSGCQARDEILVRLDKRRHIYIPNIFNPKSAQNDVVQVYGGQDVKEVKEFRIYDRWGEAIFEALQFQPNDPTKGWNGLQRGKEVVPGVYVYYVVVEFIDGQQEIFTGDVTVFR